MSEKFEQKRITIGEEALEKSVKKNQPFENKNTPIDSSKKEFEKTSDERELFEGSSYIDKKEYQQDITEETLRMAEDVIGKLLHKQEMAGKIIERNLPLFERLQEVARRKTFLENILQDLEKQGLTKTHQYESLQNQYQDELMRYNNMEKMAETSDGNLIDANEKVIRIEEEIAEKVKVLDTKNPELN